MEVDLGIDTNEGFVPERSIGLAEACEQVLRGRSGKRLHIEVARRYAIRGYRAGQAGPVLILPTVIWSGERRLMIEWARAFEAKRVELGQRRQPSIPTSRSPRRRTKQQERARRDLDVELGSTRGKVA